MAYQAGVLRALRDVGSYDARKADHIIGTSAGAVTGAYLALNRRPEQVARLTYNPTPATATRQVSSDFNMVRAWSSRTDLARRVIGSSSVMARSLVHAATPESFRRMTGFIPARTPEVLNRLFPGWLFDPEVEAVSTHIPEEWPDRHVWLVAFDIHTRKRVALGRGEERPTFDKAVMASCAVPAMIRPVRWGNRVLVDGGTTSVTNLDLAAHTHARAVIAIAPMAYNPRNPPGPVRSVLRHRHNREIAREALVVRRSGAELLVFRPGATELQHHPRNMLAVKGNHEVEESAYVAASAQLRAPAAQRFLETVHAGTGRKAKP